MKTLKTILLTIAMLGFILPSALLAQNDLIIEGYVTIAPSNLPKVGHPVTIVADTFNNPILRYVNTVYTNSNGYYVDTIVNGSLSGPNTNYFVITLDSCKNIYLRDTVQNGQGTINLARVDFTMDCGPNSNNCAVGFQSFITGAFGGMQFQSSPNDTSWSYLWDFGDGQSSTLMNPQHFYADSGVYNVCLTVSTNLGCTSSFCDFAYVSSVLDSGCVSGSSDFFSNVNNFTVDFSSDTNLSPNNTSYFWDFGDGHSSSLANPTHTYATHINTIQVDYEVCLTVVSNNLGSLCFERTCNTVTVPFNSTIFCDAEWAASRTPNSAYVFSSLHGSNTADYYWTFGDGDTSTLASPVHHFDSTGYYNVCLFIEDRGCVDAFCDSIFVVSTVSGNCVDPSVIDTNLACITLYDPVCGCDGVTYGNSCEAYYFHGVTSWTNGPCGNNNFGLSGLVTKGLNSVVQNAIVYLISADSTISGDVLLNLVDSQYTSPQGYYNFGNISPGQYYLKAALTTNDPDYHGYLPTYYDVSLFWGYATALNVSGNNNNVNIALVAGNNVGGPGFVSGLISQGAGKVAGADAAANIPILLLDMNDNAVQYTYSDASGYFEFDDIAYGTYQLYAEVLNKETEPAIITIGPDNESIENIELIIEGQKVVTSAHVNIADLSNWNLYPNPVQNNVVIEFSLQSSTNVQLSITDLLGKELVRKRLGDNISGSQRFNLDVSGLQPGVYFLNFYANDALLKVSRIFKE